MIGQSSQAGSSIPDLKWVNRDLPMRDVCVALGLHVGPDSMIHCWHPERHKNGDRTPSVSIRKSSNRLRCFGCGSKTLSVVDVVMDCLSTDVSGAARWLSEHFELRYIPKGQHLKDGHAIKPYRVGYEGPLELLVKSGFWAAFSRGTQRIVPVLCYLAKTGKEAGTFKVELSYRAIQRFSGVGSHGTISKALRELTDLGWLKQFPQVNAGESVVRDVNTYILTPYSDAVMEAANNMAATLRIEIEQERQLRRQQRNARRQSAHASDTRASDTSTAKPESALLKSTSLYSNRSVGQNGATASVAGNWRRSGTSPISPPAVVRQRLRRRAGTVRVHRHRRRQVAVSI